MDGGFKTTGCGPWTYFLSPSMVDSGAFWHKTSGTSDDAYAAPTEASLLESGVPNTPTHPLNYPEELGAQLELNPSTWGIRIADDVQGLARRGPTAARDVQQERNQDHGVVSRGWTLIC